MINTASGPVALTPERSRISLPGGTEPAAPVLTYGPYLASLAKFFARDEHTPLREALSFHFQRPISVREIHALDIISEKHGACYHVAHVRVALSTGECSLAVNVAVTDEQHRALEGERHVLEELHEHFTLPFIPRPYLTGKTHYLENEEGRRALKLLILEWFEGYHEFHLSRQKKGKPPALKVWESDETGGFLGEDEAHSLYRQAAFILTSYLDKSTFRQIYPWHHGAGDFVLRKGDDGIHVRLITARDYRSLVTWSSNPEDLWVPIIHFFLNLTIRMRLDRLDGTGELAWAPVESLHGVLSGFFEAWVAKACRDPSLPTSDDLLQLFNQMSHEDWISLGEIILEDCLVEDAEAAFLEARLDDHVSSLMKALQENPPAGKNCAGL